jgi:hypothetical protein
MASTKYVLGDRSVEPLDDGPTEIEVAYHYGTKRSSKPNRTLLQQPARVPPVG